MTDRLNFDSVYQTDAEKRAVIEWLRALIASRVGS